jgi:hypothetical protein
MGGQEQGRFSLALARWQEEIVMEQSEQSLSQRRFTRQEVLQWASAFWGRILFKPPDLYGFIFARRGQFCAIR